MKILGTSTFFVLMLFVTSNVFSESANRTATVVSPTGKVSVNKNQGIIQEIDKYNKSLVINATRYYLIDNVQVHTRSDAFGTINNLKDGTSVAYQLIDLGSDKNMISKIWILTDGSVELN